MYAFLSHTEIKKETSKDTSFWSMAEWTKFELQSKIKGKTDEKQRIKMKRNRSKQNNMQHKKISIFILPFDALTEITILCSYLFVKYRPFSVYQASNFSIHFIFLFSILSWFLILFIFCVSVLLCRHSLLRYLFM